MQTEACNKRAARSSQNQLFPGIMVQDTEDAREVVKGYSTIRNMVQWHDHSALAGMIYCPPGPGSVIWLN